MGMIPIIGRFGRPQPHTRCGHSSARDGDYEHSKSSCGLFRGGSDDGDDKKDHPRHSETPCLRRSPMTWRDMIFFSKKEDISFFTKKNLGRKDVTAFPPKNELVNFSIFFFFFCISTLRIGSIITTNTRHWESQQQYLSSLQKVLQ